MQFAGRPVEDDVTPARWIAESVRDDLTVASLVPPVFEAYARVFHPAYRYDGDDDLEVSWAEVAAANVTAAHPAMEWASITGLMEFFDQADQSPLWDGAPARGHLPAQVASTLAAVLRRHTGAPDDCWFGVPAELIPADSTPLELGTTQFWLIRGPVELAAANMAAEPAEQSAAIWWPSDRAWCVVTDLDLVTTYVGGTAACIAEVVAHPGLEAAHVPVSQGIGWTTDTVNPPPLDAPDDVG